MIRTLATLLGFLSPDGPEGPADEGADSRLPAALAESVPAPRRRASRVQQEEEPYPRPSRLDPVRRSGSADLPDALAFHVAFEMRSIQGTTQVREHTSLPARLDLGSDLGFGPSGGLRVAISKDLPSVRFSLDVEMVYGSGRGQLDKDFQYDEGNFKAGLPFDVSISAFFARPGIALKDVFGPIANGWIAPFIGLEYPRISLGIHQPGALEETSEQYGQFLPYPIVGLAARFELDSSLTLEARAFVGYVPSVPTPFMEGGRLRMTIETVDVEAELRWRLTPGVSLILGAGYQYWHGTLTSKEDGNDLKLTSPQLTLGFEVRF